MSRHYITKKRVFKKDLIFNSFLVSKFINLLMKNGKKTVAQKILYNALDYVSNKLKKNKIELLEWAINNVKPVIEVKSRRVGGTTYQIPIEIRTIRGYTLAIRWIILAARQKKNNNMSWNLANELIEAIHKRGYAFKKREDIHRMAEANKAFAYYRW